LASASPGIDPPYPVYSGLFHKEAIMLLRRFYIQENEKGKIGPEHEIRLKDTNKPRCPAPNPRPKKNRELKTSFDNEP